jgi:NodT family efflux transporter outer membrane factor (OMF) lipoprotein
MTAIGQTGCSTLSHWLHNGFKVGPNYSPPGAPLPGEWVDARDPKVRQGDPNLSTWWDVFDDPVLNRLLQESYSENLTIRAAGAQIIQAQIARFVAKTELLPQGQNAILGYLRGMGSRTGGSPIGAGPSFGTGISPGTTLTPVTVPGAPITGATATGFNNTTTPPNTLILGAAGPIAGGSATNRYTSDFSQNLNASWELDFWGLFRRNVEAANASLDQSVNNLDSMLVLLLANVASQYVEIRTLQRRLELARYNVAIQEPLVSAYEKRYRAGFSNAFPGYVQLLSNLEATRALIPSLELTLRQVNNQLCVLLGRPVHDMLPELGDGTVPDPTDPTKRIVYIPRPRDPSVVVGIPGNYLLRRPDVRAAEDALRVQSARIGIAEAELFPHIGINGSIGLASNNFNHLFAPASGTGGIGPSLTWNILNYGRLLANVRFNNLLYQQLVAEYQQSVLNANQDAENSMIGYLRSVDQTIHLRASADAAVRLTDYLIRQYEGGYLPPGVADTSAFVTQLFTAVNFRVTQQDAAAQAEGNIALNLVFLYRAMGGGWQIRLQPPADGRVQAGEESVGPPAPPGAAGAAPPAPPSGRSPWDVSPLPPAIPGPSAPAPPRDNAGVPQPIPPVELTPMVPAAPRAILGNPEPIPAEPAPTAPAAPSGPRPP